MFEFILKYWDSVLTVILFLIVMLVLVRRGAVAQVQKIAFFLATLAEDEFGGGTGELKFAAVTTWLYERLPIIVKLLFTPKQIDKLIEDAVKKMKEYLDENEAARILILPPEEALD